MYPNQVKELIRDAVKAPDQVCPSIFLLGQPGIGKSAIPKQVSEEEKLGWLDTRASQHDPTDFRGIPAVIERKALWLPPEDIPYANNPDLPEKGIWMIDEVTSSPPLVQAVLYQAILDNAIGEHKLKPGWVKVAAGNRMKDKAVVMRMSSALKNRFVWVDFEPNLDDWIDWAQKKLINPNIIGFIQWRGGELLAPEFDIKVDENAFPTPRTWEFASRLIEVISDRGILHECLDGCVGKGATSEFMAFLKVQTEIPDIDGILAGTKKWYPPDGRIDLRYALVSALASRAKGKDTYDRMLTYSEKLPAEFGVLLVTTLSQRDPQTMFKTNGYAQWARDHSDIIVSRKKVN